MKILIASERPMVNRCETLHALIQDSTGVNADVRLKEAPGDWDLVIVVGDKGPGHITPKKNIHVPDGEFPVWGHWTGASQPRWFMKLVDKNYVSMIELREEVKKMKEGNQ